MLQNKTKHNFETCLNEVVKVFNFLISKSKKITQPDFPNFHENVLMSRACR